MKIPDMGCESSKNLLETIKKRASSYTPEWRMDPDNPDGGTALALLFAGMHEDTLKKYAQLPRKNMLDFFRCAGTELMAARPAKGYAVFGLVNQETEGTDIRRGTGLLARAEEEQGEQGEDIVYETRNDVYVTPSEIGDLIQVLPQKDGIYRIYSAGEGEKETPGVFSLFKECGENMQEHVLYLAHSYAFFLKRSGTIRLKLTRSRKRMVEAEILRALADPECVVFEYSTGEQFEPFAAVTAKAERGEIHLYKEEHQPEMERCRINDTENYWIRIRCKDISRLCNLELEDIRLDPDSGRSEPDVIFAGGIEQRGEYLPFGEQMGLYEEVYFSSEQALSQKQAQITLSFQMSFFRIPTETYGQERKRDWKLIMKRSDFIPDPEYDIGIDEVIWEYYNGYDWRKLPQSDRYSGIFRAASDQLEKNTEITFECPKDLTPVLVQSVEGWYIRARILKMNNQYRWNGQYITPVLRNTAFEYSYRAPFPAPELLEYRNALQSERIRPEDYFKTGKSLKPFLKLQETEETLYLGFTQEFERWPIRILFQIAGGRQSDKLLHYEYFSRSGWQPLNLIDGTDGFERTGIVTLLGNSDFMDTKLWGRQRFWIRIRNQKGEDEDTLHTVIRSIWMNATEITAEETKEAEVFSIEANEKNAKFMLSSGHITRAEVWVKEQRIYSEEELTRLREQIEIRTEKSQDGTAGHVWIRWEEQENFAASNAEDRHYILDRDQGSLSFSDGVHGRIPDACDGNSIRVEYRSGGGKRGNAAAGAITRFRETYGFVNQVMNPLPLSGGTDQETVEMAIVRQGRALRHRRRAVTAGDYEALALESSGSILRAKCFSGPGMIRLVLLIRNHETERENFYQISRECMNYLKDKLPVSLLESGQFRIMEPEFATVSVKAEILVSDMNQILETRQQVLNVLHQFLDPMKGNFKGNGWDIGILPNRNQILNEIRRVSGVRMVTKLRLIMELERNGKKLELDPDETAAYSFATVIEGKHQIDITTGGVSD